MRAKFLIITFLICLAGDVAGQIDSVSTIPDTLFVKKEKCDFEKNGFRLTIVESTDGSLQNSACNFTYENLFMAADKDKISLIEELLAFEDDTAKTCCNVYCYRQGFSMHKQEILSTGYNLQISALYHINLICFGSNATFYAPFPVLIDTVTNQEINYSLSSLKEVFSLYRQWFETCRDQNFKSFYFPLVGTRYRWKFGSQTMKVFSGLPVYESDFRFSIGKKVR